MAYKSTIPLATDKKNASQSDIKDNFTALKTFMDGNHVLETGKHSFVTINQGTVDADFPLVTSATEMGIYCKTDGANPALYVRKESQTVGVVTNDINFTTAGLTSPGWCRLPCGLLMKWGLSTANGVETITFPTGGTIPEFLTAVYSIQLTPYGTDAGNMNREIRLRSYGLLETFGVVATRRYANNLDTCQFTYLAIGI